MGKMSANETHKEIQKTRQVMLGYCDDSVTAETANTAGDYRVSATTCHRQHSAGMTGTNGISATALRVTSFTHSLKF